MEKLELREMIGGSLKCYNHFRKLYGGFFYNYIYIYPLTQKFHSNLFIQEN